MEYIKELEHSNSTLNKQLEQEKKLSKAIVDEFRNKVGQIMLDLEVKEESFCEKNKFPSSYNFEGEQFEKA